MRNMKEMNQGGRSGGWAFWALLLAGVLALACPALAGAGDLAVDGGFVALAAAGDTVYLLDGERDLFVVRAGEAFPAAPVCRVSRDADFLMTDQGKLYGWEAVTGALYCIDVGTGEVSEERVVGVGDAIDIRDGYTQGGFSAPVLDEGMLTVHWEEPYHMQGIVRFAPDGSRTDYDLDGDSTLFYGGPGGRVIVVPDWCGQKELGELDEQTDDFTWIRTLPLDTWGIAAQGEAVYVGAGNYIERFASMEATEGEIVACLPRTGIDLGNQAMKILDGGWAALISHGTFYLERLESGLHTRALTLPPALNSAWDRNAAFLADNPDVALRFADWWMMHPTTEAEYRQAIADLEADILVCYLRDSPWQAMKAEGFAADVSASAPLQQAVAGMYPAIRAACLHEGRAVGVPYACGVDWSIQQIDKHALMAHTGLAEDQLPGTFLALPDALRRAQAGVAGEPLDRDVARRLCEAFTEQYVAYFESRGEPLVFHTPLFRAGLALRDLAPAVPSAAEGDALDDVVRYGASLSPSRAPGILPLALDAERPYTFPITLEVLFVNPDSPNLDLAIAYLESAVQNMRPEERVLWMPGDWQPVPNPDYEAMLAEYTGEADLLRAKAAAFADEEGYSWSARMLPYAEEKAEDFAESGRWLVSPAFLEESSFLLDQMVIYRQDFFAMNRYAHPNANGRTAGGLRARYMNGEIDAEALIAGLQAIANAAGLGM